MGREPTRREVRPHEIYFWNDVPGITRNREKSTFKQSTERIQEQETTQIMVFGDTKSHNYQ